jgi:hypothetical protein
MPASPTATLRPKPTVSHPHRVRRVMLAILVRYAPQVRFYRTGILFDRYSRLHRQLRQLFPV